MTNTKDKFIRDLIDELNDTNSYLIKHSDMMHLIDIPFVVSVVDQQIENCKEFLNDISKYTYYIDDFTEDTINGFTNGKIRISIKNPDKENNLGYADYCYYIEFLYDEKMWGYCQCTSDMEDYNEKHDCCGCSCDWYSPSFRLYKETNLGCYNWEGLQRDYWDYEEKFLTNEKNKIKEVIKFQKEQEKKRLEDQIEILQQKLDELIAG